jgi:hypothetical protein
MEELKEKYRDRDVEFVAIYVRESHAGERGFADIPDPESFEQKMELARELKRIKKVTIEVGVDEMSQEQHARLGNLPNVAYVVDRDGRVAYHNTSQHADDIDATRARLVTADDPSGRFIPRSAPRSWAPISERSHETRRQGCADHRWRVGDRRRGSSGVRVRGGPGWPWSIGTGTGRPRSPPRSARPRSPTRSM